MPAGEFGESRRLEAPVGDTGCHEQRARLQLAGGPEADRPDRPALLERHDVQGEQHLRAEPGHLCDGPVGEVGP